MEKPDSPTGCPETGVKLAALLDGELPQHEQIQLEEHLRRCSDCAADLARQRAAQIALRTLAVSLQPPAQLRNRVTAGLNRRAQGNATRRRLIFFGGLAAALGLCAIFAQSRAAGPTPSVSVLARVVAEHKEETQGATPVSFASADAAQVAAWARSGTGEYFEVPSFEAAGYRLLGARVEPSVAPRAVTLVYEGDSGRLTCTVVPITDPLERLLALRAATAPTKATRIQGETVASWRDKDTTYVLVADLDADALLGLARLAVQPD
ncbi:MAG TPA: zf-HC2 domain-containing protein [Dehalococcoidia bacterium]|nr:zf-HC2 domain-containing protein [Dehalococcoidia bacterium]